MNGILFGKVREVAKEAVSLASGVTRFLCLLHVTQTYVFSPICVHGSSMLPTLNHTGDVLLVEHASHRLGKVGPGDVVFLRSPANPLRMITKRVVGMEGDLVTFLPNPSVSDLTRTIRIPKGHVWVQGDNMYASTDSRHFGPVPYGLIQGKAFLRVWPPYGFGMLEQ